MEGTIFETTTEKISEDKKDSFWYKGMDIARIQFPNGKKLYAEASGHIAVCFNPEDVYYKDEQAVEKAIELELTDKDLDQLGMDDLWRNNNWFRIIMIDINGEECSDDLAIGHDYDEAVELLKAVAKEEFDKMYKTYGGDK